MGNDDDCRLSAGYISKRKFEQSPGFSRSRARYLEWIRCLTDEEKRVASLGGVEERPGTCDLTPALHHRLSNQEEARVFSNRGEERERDDVEQKVALALRCDDAKMSLVVRKNEKVCAVFIQKV